MSIDASQIEITIRPANNAGSRWEISVTEIYINEDTAAHAIQVLMSALRGEQ